MAALVPNANAIHSGIAVRASEKLWMVSANKATDPEITTITNCAIEVAPRASRLIFTARIPAALDSRAPSMLSEASWLCGAKISLDHPESRPFETIVTVIVVVTVTVAVSSDRDPQARGRWLVRWVSWVIQGVPVDRRPGSNRRRRWAWGSGWRARWRQG